jgi:hypothetical protein
MNASKVPLVCKLSTECRTLVGGWYAMDHRLGALERNFEKLSVAVVELVRLDERLKDFGRRIDNLERR